MHCNCGGKPGEERACSGSKYRAAAEVWALPPRARLAHLILSLGCGGQQGKLPCKPCVSWDMPVPWGPGCGRPDEGLSRRISTQSEESFLELALGAAVTSSAPPFGRWDCHLPGTLLTVGGLTSSWAVSDAFILPAAGTRCS